MAKLYIVGMGPGDYAGMTIEAAEAIRACDCVVGYTTYIKLLEEIMGEDIADKEILSTGMRQEAERCHMALKSAAGGRKTALVCSGDAVVYGLAGLVYELSEGYAGADIKVISGVTAALSGGALLGAPLGHDFAVISLSDLLTPWDKIVKRLKMAAEADMCIALYNPGSRTRADYLRRAVTVLLGYLPENTVCGVVKNIGRDGESWQSMSLKELGDYEADMFTTVFVGNSETVNINGYMVTPRGYLNEKKH